VPHKLLIFGPLSRTFSLTELVYNNESGKGTTMFALITFAVVLLVLIAGLGLPYPQTWHGRWGSDR
jgi:hypothetical protein